MKISGQCTLKGAVRVCADMPPDAAPVLEFPLEIIARPQVLAFGYDAVHAGSLLEPNGTSEDCVPDSGTLKIS